MKRISFVFFVLFVANVFAGNGPVSFAEQSLGKDDESIKKIKVISNGKSVNLRNYLVKGYVVVFEFYADWCGYCRILSPKVDSLTKQYKNVLVRKININNWRSPVVKQYRIIGVPSVWVFDVKGRMVGRPTPDFRKILFYLKQAGAK